jgi:hypothetical protein
MSQVRSIALAYDSRQDRLFASVNPGATDACGFWLTRRIVLDILARLPPVLAQHSPAVRQTPVQHRREVAEFEREVAVGAAHFTQTPNEQLRALAAEAQLVETLSFDVHLEGVAVNLLGIQGRRVSGIWTRDDVQRLLHLLQQEVVKAGWAVPATFAPGTQPKPN